MESCCSKNNKKIDLLFWITLSIVVLSYAFHIFNLNFGSGSVAIFNLSIFDIMNKMWWGLVLGVLFVGVIDFIPKTVITKLLGTDGGAKGLFRAAFAGLFFDLCSHGILLIAMKFYERGVSLPQLMAFLIASPWNSLSLTVILWSLIGFGWTFLFIVLSFIVAIISGFVFQFFIKKKVLPKNPHHKEIDFNFSYKQAFREEYKDKKVGIAMVFQVFKKALQESEMILRWIFFGTIIASLIRTFVPDDMFAHYFGASILGLIFTLVATTIIEVCSEGSVPIAADILGRASAPGNAFVFLMAGVATDYTEILALRETTKSLKIALFLPLVTVPQILVLGFIINYLSG